MRAQRAETRALALRTLYETSAVVGSSLDERLREMLRIGCKYFGLPYGIVSRIDDATYTVRQAVAVDAEPRAAAAADPMRSARKA